MVQLFLSEPHWEDDASWDGGELGERWKNLLNQLESIIWSLISSGSRSEARLWLSTAVSGISSLSPNQQREIFVDLMTRKPTNRALATQVLQMVFERRPHKAGAILAKRSSALENFFQGNSTRILQWFAHFASGGRLDHTKGAKALTQFAFVNRDICWEELEWKGKHGQSPAVVATKPHYLLDLDVQQTVENFLENVPEFWSSDEFAESLKDGDIVSIDTKFFIGFFLGLMYKEEMKDVWTVISEFLEEESFLFLCQHLLITLEELEFRNFLKLLSNYVSPRMGGHDFRNTTFWLEFVISRSSERESFDELLLTNAVINQGRQLLKLVNEEEFQEEREKIKEITSQICSMSNSANSLVPLLNECVKSNINDAAKLLGLQSWVLHYTLSEKYDSPQSWEYIFSSNNISFRKAEQYTLLDNSGFSEENGSSDDIASHKRRQRTKKKRGKKRRRKVEHRDIDDDELFDFDKYNDMFDLQSSAGSWLLSTDGFSASWTTADLPEHLTKFCFSVWMKWTYATRSNVD